MRDVKGRNAKAAEELRALAAAENISISVVEIDVLDDQSIASGVAEGISRFGRIDVLINNAGITVPGPIELQPQAAF
jgi:NAD(P)-dependent dehydrogenase (short-subunit alcohol dehydrogenase family)